MKCDRSKKRDAWLRRLALEINELRLALMMAGIADPDASVIASKEVLGR